ncbi:hypothetical protein DPMN_000247 [Dreissena polymorpha]|uniref:Uncharacterized protein n=1 Tax=Dreissena polymorpha TaxID=45954 RepID=A0A9D4RRX2_DREPO|nr:hypothetical protein DPMN_000247 [Dreissena polymorpha]
MGMGFGAYFNGRWCQGAWPLAWLEEGLLQDITVLELFPIVVAIFVWVMISVIRKLDLIVMALLLSTFWTNFQPNQNL